MGPGGVSGSTRGSSARTRQGRQPGGGPGALWVLSEFPAKRRTDSQLCRGADVGLKLSISAVERQSSSAPPQPVCLEHLLTVRNVDELCWPTRAFYLFNDGTVVAVRGGRGPSVLLPWPRARRPRTIPTPRPFC